MHLPFQLLFMLLWATIIIQEYFYIPLNREYFISNQNSSLILLKIKNEINCLLIYIVYHVLNWFSRSPSFFYHLYFLIDEHFVNKVWSKIFFFHRFLFTYFVVIFFLFVHLLRLISSFFFRFIFIYSDFGWQFVTLSDTMYNVLCMRVIEATFCMLCVYS